MHDAHQHSGELETCSALTKTLESYSDDASVVVAIIELTLLSKQKPKSSDPSSAADAKRLMQQQLATSKEKLKNSMKSASPTGLYHGSCVMLMLDKPNYAKPCCEKVCHPPPVSLSTFHSFLVVTTACVDHEKR